MNKELQKKRNHKSFIHFLYLVFFTSMIFSFRGITSICLGAMLLTAIIIQRQTLDSFFQKKSRTLFLAGCVFLFLLQLIALFYTNDMQQGWNNVRIKTGLLITPLVIYFFSHLDETVRKKLFSHYFLLLVAATLYCLYISFLNFRETNNPSSFFYHELAGPIHQHAVYFSVLIVIGLIFLSESLLKKDFLFNRLFHICLIIYLSVFLFLLSSKLVIGFYVIYLVYYFINLLQKNKLNRLAIASSFMLFAIIVSLLFATRNPVSERFNDVLKGNIKIVTQESFNEGDYFNGLQFRLLQWRFVTEILTENKQWWLGVSPGDAQILLNKKYISKKMYAGDPIRGDRGYLIYNTHNQFLETLLQTGIIGLAVLLLICFSLLQMAMQEKSRITSFVILLLLAWLFTESVFETQYGIVIFTFFPLFICTTENQTATQRPGANLLKTYSDI